MQTKISQTQTNVATHLDSDILDGCFTTTWLYFNGCSSRENQLCVLSVHLVVYQVQTVKKRNTFLQLTSKISRYGFYGYNVFQTTG